MGARLRCSSFKASTQEYCHYCIWQMPIYWVCVCNVFKDFTTSWEVPSPRLTRGQWHAIFVLWFPLGMGACWANIPETTTEKWVWWGWVTQFPGTSGNLKWTLLCRTTFMQIVRWLIRDSGVLILLFQLKARLCSGGNEGQVELEPVVLCGSCFTTQKRAMTKTGNVVLCS